MSWGISKTKSQLYLRPGSNRNSGGGGGGNDVEGLNDELGVDVPELDDAVQGEMTFLSPVAGPEGPEDDDPAE